MLIHLITLESFALRSLHFFQFIAVFLTGFIFWKRGREEHYPEAELFDGFLKSLLFGWLVGRLGFIALNFQNFGLNLLSWLDLWGKPGFDLRLLLIAAGVYLYRFAKKKKWDAFEVMDFWATALSLGMIWLHLGYFLDGSQFGVRTSLPWGIVFPGVFEPHHPIQLYSAIFYGLIFYYLNWLEYHYRTFEWYRAGKKTAETGFLLINFLISSSIFRLLITLITPTLMAVLGLELDDWINLALLILGFWLLLKRSHRSFFSFKKLRFFALKA